MRSKKRESTPVFGYSADTVNDDQVIRDLAELKKITNEEIGRSDPALGDILRIIDDFDDDQDDLLTTQVEDYEPQSCSTTDTSEEGDYENQSELILLDSSDEMLTNILSDEEGIMVSSDSTPIKEDRKPVYKHEAREPGKSILKKHSTSKIGKGSIRFSGLPSEPEPIDLSESLEQHPIVSRFRALVNRTSISNLAAVLMEFGNIFNSNRQAHSFHFHANALWVCLSRQLGLQPENITNETLMSVCANFAIFVAGIHRTVDGRIGEYIAYRLSSALINEDGTRTKVYAAMLGALFSTCVVSNQLLIGYMNWTIEQSADCSQQSLDSLVYLIKYHGKDLSSDDPECLRQFAVKFENCTIKPTEEHNRTWFCWKEVLESCSSPSTQIDWTDIRKSIFKITKIRARTLCVDLDFKSLCRSGNRFRLEEKSFEEDKKPVKDYKYVAVELRLRTPLRESILKSILSSSDYIEACDNIASMKLSQAEQKQVVVVLIKMALNERPFNEFYGLVLNRLAKQNGEPFNRQLRLHLRKHVLDRTEISHNLATLIARLLEEGSIDLRVLKAFNWSKNQHTGRMEFVRNIIIAVVIRKPETWIKTVFSCNLKTAWNQGNERELFRRLRDFLENGFIRFERVANDLGQNNMKKVEIIVENINRLLDSPDLQQ